jgi:uncharacterized protein with PIN domain
MPVRCSGCGRSYADERFASGRTLWCACGQRVGVAPTTGDGPAERPPRFAVDAMLGRLARWLRVLGLDATWTADVADAELVRHALDEGRWVLTRDRTLGEEWSVPRLHLVGSERPLEQLREILDAFALRGDLRLFARCTRCNAPIEELPRALAAPHVPPRVLERNERFWRCPGCGRIYWEGTHVDRMRETLARLLGPT